MQAGTVTIIYQEWKSPSYLLPHDSLSKASIKKKVACNFHILTYAPSEVVVILRLQGLS